MPDTCQPCGACCFSSSSAYVPVTAADRARLGPGDAALIHTEDAADYMAMVDGRCAALEAGYTRFRCTIYSRRPAVCRELDRGTPACREEQRLKQATARRALLPRAD